MSPIARVYGLLVERTGIQAAEVEKLLASHLVERS